MHALSLLVWRDNGDIERLATSGPTARYKT